MMTFFENKKILISFLPLFLLMFPTNQSIGLDGFPFEGKVEVLLFIVCICLPFFAKNLDTNLPNFVIKVILNECIGLKKLKRSGKYIYNTDRFVKISKGDQMNWEKIENIFISHKFSPPIVSDLASNLGMEVKVLQDLLDRLCNLGLLIRLTEKRYFSSSTLLELAKILEGIIDKNNNGYLDLKKFRDESGMGRNLAIEVLDFFDKAGFTQLGKEGRFIKRPVSEVSLFKRSFD